MVAINPFGIQQLQQAAGQALTEMSPMSQPQQMPQQAPGGFPTPTTGNPAMDQFANWAASRTGFLNQARMQDVNNQWQRTVASQDNFGSKYQRGRLVGQQLFNDVLAPLMSGPGAGGAQGAYEFIKDTNKRIDDAMTNQNSERLKTAQTLNSLATIAAKADSQEWEKMGETIKLHNAAAKLNDQQILSAYHRDQQRKMSADATVANDTIKSRTAFQQARAEEKQTQAKSAVEKLAQERIQKETEYRKLWHEHQKLQEAYKLQPSKEAAQAALVKEREARAKHAEYQQITEQMRAQNLRTKGDSDAAESQGRQDLTKVKSGTEKSRGKYWANKASGVDPKQQSQVSSIVKKYKAAGMPVDEMKKRVDAIKDPAQKRLFMDAIDSDEVSAADDDEDDA